MRMYVFDPGLASARFCRSANPAHGLKQPWWHVSCGARTHAELPPVDLKSTPLTTRAN